MNAAMLWRSSVSRGAPRVVRKSLGSTCSLAALAILPLLVCGCGGQRQHESTLERGKAVFVTACSSCHTLTGHDSRAPGGDLAIGRFTVPDIESFVRIMPVHISPADVQAVADYVRSKMKPSGQSG